jgi:hypothetical protein
MSLSLSLSLSWCLSPVHISTRSPTTISNFWAAMLNPMASAILFSTVALCSAAVGSNPARATPSLTTGFVGTHTASFLSVTRPLSKCKATVQSQLGLPIKTLLRNQRITPGFGNNLRMVATELEKPGQVRDLTTAADCNPRYGETGGAMLLMNDVTVQRYQYVECFWSSKSCL